MKCLLTLSSECFVFTLLPNNMQTARYGILIIPVIYVGRYNDFLWSDGFGDPIPVGVRFPAPVQTGPGANPGPVWTRSLSRGWSRRGVAFTIHPHLAPRLKKVYNYTILPLWAFVACSGAKFTFTINLNLGWNLTATGFLEGGWWEQCFAWEREKVTGWDKMHKSNSLYLSPILLRQWN